MAPDRVNLFVRTSAPNRRIVERWEVPNCNILFGKVWFILPDREFRGCRTAHDQAVLFAIRRKATWENRTGENEAGYAQHPGMWQINASAKPRLGHCQASKKLTPRSFHYRQGSGADPGLHLAIGLVCKELQGQSSHNESKIPVSATVLNAQIEHITTTDCGKPRIAPPSGRLHYD